MEILVEGGLPDKNWNISLLGIKAPTPKILHSSVRQEAWNICLLTALQIEALFLGFQVLEEVCSFCHLSTKLIYNQYIDKLFSFWGAFFFCIFHFSPEQNIPRHRIL